MYPELAILEAAVRVPKFELRRIPSGVQADGRRPIRLPVHGAEILGPLVSGLDVEVALALLLDGRNRAMGVVEVARGGANVVHVSARDVFRVAIHVGAIGLVFAHNHPSGDVVPSAEDVDLTKRLKAAGELVGVTVLDHLILSDSEYFSFSDGRQGRWTAEDLPKRSANGADPG